MAYTWTRIALSSFLFLNACVAYSLDLCPINLNDTVTSSSNITWAQAVQQPIRTFSGPSYLRPDIGGALVPWVYSIVILLVHIPVVIIRVVKWEAVQTWCLGATVFTIAVTAQAFESTGFRSDKILTWTPLLLVIDAGSMAQVLFLIIEDYDLVTRLRCSIMPHRIRPSEEPFLPGKEAGKGDDRDEYVFVAIPNASPTESTSAPTAGHPPFLASNPLYIAHRTKSSEKPFVLGKETGKGDDSDERVFVAAIRSASPTESISVPTAGHPPLLASKPLYIAHRIKPSEEPFLPNKEAGKGDDSDERVFIAIPSASLTVSIFAGHPPLFASKPLYIAIISFLLLLSIFALQTLGLHHAVLAAKQSAPSVSWCSPIFQPFGVAVLDGGCNIWPIMQTFTKGVGCILIPGNQQLAWLKATVAGTSLSIALELLDICILATVHSGSRWRGIKMRRPWFTMFSGVAVLGLILVFGVVYGTILPPGISEKVWVVTDAGAVTVYEGELGTAGLRGAMIGWNDGVFQGWGSTYFGSWAN